MPAKLLIFLSALMRITLLIMLILHLIMAQKTTYGLIGRTLGHSFSKQFFTLKFEELGLDAEYLNFELTDIGDFMELLAEYPLIKGLNVTIPYKQAVIPYLDRLSDDAQQIGAVNVIKILGTPDNPVLHGYNTDADGFRLDLEPILPTPHPEKALVLGCGGASKAVCFALRKLGITPVVVSRNPSENQISYHDITADILNEYPLIVNTTPLGMWPDTDTAPEIPYHLLSQKNICYDLVYNPQPTLFLEKAAQNGAITRGGRGMLVNQAELAWKIWNE